MATKQNKNHNDFIKNMIKTEKNSRTTTKQ